VPRPFADPWWKVALGLLALWVKDSAGWLGGGLFLIDSWIWGYVIDLLINGLPDSETVSDPKWTPDPPADTPPHDMGDPFDPSDDPTAQEDPPVIGDPPAAFGQSGGDAGGDDAGTSGGGGGADGRDAAEDNQHQAARPDKTS
jgi:hypothetical protein